MRDPSVTTAIRIGFGVSGGYWHHLVLFLYDPKPNSLNGGYPPAIHRISGLVFGDRAALELGSLACPTTLLLLLISSSYLVNVEKEKRVEYKSEYYTGNWDIKTRNEPNKVDLSLQQSQKDISKFRRCTVLV